MRQWTHEERTILKAEYNITPLDELAMKLDRSPSAVYKQVHILRKKGWTFNRVGDKKAT